MEINNLIGRIKEKAELDRCLESDRSELVIIYGRRRVGKTFLVEQHFNQKFDFWYVGVRGIRARDQLANFARTLKEYTGENYRFNNWFDAFDALKQYLKKLPADRKKVVFIDEMPWIDSGRSNFVPALENFWNGWAMSRCSVMLIATGSATSWMRDKLIANKGGLHGRITSQIYLKPFCLGETEQYLEQHGFSCDRYQILLAYMLLGGVPFYYSLLDRRLSIAQNIDALCFAEGGKLRMEFDELYNALFRHADRYIEVVRELSRHKYGLTYTQLSENVDIQGAHLTRVLKNLERCDFIEKWPQYGNKKRQEVFRLSDPYTLFYYRFIEDNDIREEDWWCKNQNSPEVISWMGLGFEMICLKHYRQIKKALGLGVVSTELSTWHYAEKRKSDKPSVEKDSEQSQTGSQGAQVDMVIDRADRIIHLCEMKFSVGKFALSRAYENRLRERMAQFQLKTKTSKALVNTFVTTFGVQNAMAHSLVHSEVTMDDLFDII